MENTNNVKVVYAGARVQDNKRVQIYLDYETGEKFIFSKKLAGYEAIGTLLEGERTGGTFSKMKPVEGYLEPTHILYEKILSWHTESKAAELLLSSISMAKKEHPKSLTALIKTLKDSMWNIPKRDRIKLARFIFEELIK